MLIYQTLAFTTHGKIHNKTIIYLKYLDQCGMNSLNYLMCHILYQIFNIVSISLKTYSD